MSPTDREIHIEALEATNDVVALDPTILPPTGSEFPSLYSSMQPTKKMSFVQLLAVELQQGIANLTWLDGPSKAQQQSLQTFALAQLQVHFC